MKYFVLSGFFYILFFVVLNNIYGEIETKENDWNMYDDDKYSILFPTSFDIYKGIKDVDGFDLKLIDNTLTKTIITVNEKIPDIIEYFPEFFWEEEDISEGEKIIIYNDEMNKYENEKNYTPIESYFPSSSITINNNPVYGQLYETGNGYHLLVMVYVLNHDSYYIIETISPVYRYQDNKQTIYKIINSISIK